MTYSSPQIEVLNMIQTSDFQPETSIAGINNQVREADTLVNRDLNQLQARVAARLEDSAMREEISRLQANEAIANAGSRRMQELLARPKAAPPVSAERTPPASDAAAISATVNPTAPDASAKSTAIPVARVSVRLPDLTSQPVTQPDSADIWDAVVGEENARHAKARGLR